MDPVAALPREIALLIFKKFDICSLVSAGQVNKSWRQIARDHTLWMGVNLEEASSRVLTTESVVMSLQDPSEFHQTTESGRCHCFTDDDDDVLDDGSNKCVRHVKAQLRRVPEVRSFLRVLSAAPVLGALTLKHTNRVCRFPEALLSCACAQVRALRLQRDPRPGPEWMLSLLERWAPSLRSLRLDVLDWPVSRLLVRMPWLEVLHFARCRRDCEKGSSFSASMREPVVPAGTFASLIELDILETAPQRTVVSLLETHHSTLRRVHLPLSITGRKLKMLTQCSHLERLQLQVQPNLPAIVSKLPQLRHLILEEAGKDEELAEGSLPPLLETLCVRTRDRDQPYGIKVFVGPGEWLYPRVLMGSMLRQASRLPSLRSVTLLAYERDFYAPKVFDEDMRKAAMPHVTWQCYTWWLPRSAAVSVLDGNFTGLTKLGLPLPVC